MSSTGKLRIVNVAGVWSFFGVDECVLVAGDVQGQHPMVLGYQESECLAVELLGPWGCRPRRIAECLGVLEHALLFLLLYGSPLSDLFAPSWAFF